MDRQIWMMLELLPRLNLVLLKSPVAGTMPPLLGPSSALAASKTMQDAQVPDLVATAAPRESLATVAARESLATAATGAPGVSLATAATAAPRD